MSVPAFALPPTVAPIGSITQSENASPVQIDLAGVFTDPEGLPMVFAVDSNDNPSLVGTSLLGSVLTLTFAPNQSGSATIQVSATDVDLPPNTVVDTFTVDVTAVNQSPVVGAAPSAVTVAEDSGAASVSLAGVFSDPDGDALTLSVSSNTNSALFASNPTMSGTTLQFTPAANANGTATLTIVADDGNGGTATVTLDINVTPVNDAPVVAAPPSPVTVAEDSGAASVSLAGVFNDPDGDALTLSVSANTNSGLFAPNPTVSGTTLQFTPAPNANGAATLTIRAQDGNGGSATVTLDINVTPVNDSPVVAAAPPPITVAEDSGPKSVSMAAVFTDPDGNPLVLTVTGSTNGPLFSVAPVMAGTQLQFTPAPNANGSATATIQADDGNGGTVSTTVTINVTPVNDAPVVVTPLAAVTVVEDSGTSVIALGGNFTDVDGDPLTFQVSANTNPGLFSSAPTISGTTLQFTPKPNANGTATLTIRANDGKGGVVTTPQTITITPVNDAPTVLAPLADMTLPEDSPPTTISLAAVFGDVDVATNGDSLTFSLTNTNTGLVTASVVGTTLTLTPILDQNGSATITVQAKDAAGATVTDDFVLTITPVNDVPIARDDAATMNEDDPGITINVLANDYLADAPTTVTRAGATVTIAGQSFPNSSESPPTTVDDPLGNPKTLPNGTVTIQGTSIFYEPKPNFYGTDWFTYQITDSDGDTATARVTVTVSPTNDAPIGVQERSYTIVENTVLTVPAAQGVLQGAYDVDNKLLDSNGNEVGGQTVSVVLDTLPINGTLTFDPATGAFSYVPLLNFVGEDQFTFRLSDGLALSATPDYVVRIVVTQLPPPPPPPPPGAVVTPYNLSNTPLEQIAGVPSNVLVVMDDSGSMDWNATIKGTSDGGFTISNSTVATKSVREETYTYVFDLKTNTYPASTSFGHVLPTEAALAADANFSGNNYGVWRGRSAKYNTIYYNPAIRYVPWIGQDIVNQNLANSVPTAARLNPIDPTRVINLTTPVSYKASGVPKWSANGGSADVNVTNFYLPMYWATTASPPLAWNAPHTLVEIKPGAGPLPGGLFPGGPQRTDCAVDDGDPSTCTYAQELQNFANWFTYFRSREYVTKSGIGTVVAGVQDLRVGYDTVSNTTSLAIAPMNDNPSEGNKKALLDNVYKVSSFGGTPLRQVLARAGKTFECSTGNYCPILPPPDGTCQRNFTLLFSDGYWNGGVGVPGNTDIDGPGPFDGGCYADNFSATLADTAMYYYETDLWPSYPDQVPVGPRDIAGAPPGTFSATQPLMHQHMQTYVIGFGLDGTFDPATVPTDPTVPFAWTDPFAGDLQKIDDLVHTAKNGRGTYVSANDPVQLRAAFEAAFLEFTQAASSVSAAAFNSTSLRDGTLLYRAFFDLRNNTGDLTATPVDSAGNLAATPIWSAAQELDTLNPANRVIVTYDRAAVKGIPFEFANLNANQKLTLTNQEVDYLRGSRAAEVPAGTLRTRPATKGLLGDIVNSSPVFVGPPVAINRDQAPFPTSQLYSTFASTYQSRPAVVYVGANDGMLHGFDASTGKEVFGYVPNKLIDGTQTFKNDLERFTQPFYSHQYYVDQTPRLNDAFMHTSASGAKAWQSVLVGGLGVGGKGYFALNVTDPANAFASESNAASRVMWEFTDVDDTYPKDVSGNPLGGAVGAVVDPTGAPVKDLGYAVSIPTVAMSNVKDTDSQNKWVAVFGNGYNSTAGIATLFVLFMDAGLDGWSSGDFVKLSTGVGVPAMPAQGAGFPNALGTPALVDRDLNGTIDLAYAGDLLGNMYRFDLSDPDPTKWKVTKIFTATYSDGTLQPITKQPVVVKHPTQPGFMVIFGTGSYVTKADARDTNIQSVYGIWDRLDSVPATAAADTRSVRLVQQTVTNVVEEVNGVAVTRRVITNNPVTYTPEGASPGVYGWYWDLNMPRATTTTSGNANPDTSGNAPPAPQYPGEKAIRRMIYRDGTIVTTTVLPATGDASCFGARPGAVMLFDLLTGGDPGRPVVDFNNDGKIDANDLVTVGGVAYAAGLLFNQQDLDGTLVDMSTLGGEADTDFLFVSGGDETIAMRIIDAALGRVGRLSWREILDNQ
jgi:type IV pilus assembly protein PilY1